MENGVYFSATLASFIPQAWKDDGTYSEASWPADAVLLTDEEMQTYWKQNPPDGKKLSSSDGRPEWVGIPAPTKDESIAAAAPDGSCSFTYRSTSKKKGEFNSPRYPTNYPSFTNCTYHFLATDNEQVTLVFDNFKIRADNINDSLGSYG